MTRYSGQPLLICILLAGGCERKGDASRPGTTPADSVPRQVGGQAPAESAGSEWQIVPGGSVGPLTRETSEADLRQHFGATAVDSSRIPVGEGETMQGTVLYPGDSLRRAEIIWQDSTQRRSPARIILRGDRSLWQVGRGISLGTSLQELERLNGRPFVLAGFGWDYSGVVTDWKGGALDSSLVGVKLYLDPGPSQYESATYAQVLGDRDYSSSLPPMQQLAPRVYQIFVDFESP
jgi:hypothetical protein